MAAMFTHRPGAGKLIGELLRSPGEGAQPRQRDHYDAGKPGVGVSWADENVKAGGLN